MQNRSITLLGHGGAAELLRSAGYDVAVNAVPRPRDAVLFVADTSSQGPIYGADSVESYRRIDLCDRHVTGHAAILFIHEEHSDDQEVLEFSRMVVDHQLNGSIGVLPEEVRQNDVKLPTLTTKSPTFLDELAEFLRSSRSLITLTRTSYGHRFYDSAIRSDNSE